MGRYQQAIRDAAALQVERARPAVLKARGRLGLAGLRVLCSYALPPGPGPHVRCRGEGPVLLDRDWLIDESRGLLALDLWHEVGGIWEKSRGHRNRRNRRAGRQNTGEFFIEPTDPDDAGGGNRWVRLPALFRCPRCKRVSSIAVDNLPTGAL